VVTRTDNATEHDTALEYSLTHDGASDRTSSDITQEVAKNMDQMELHYAGKQEHNSYTVRRDPGNICVWKVLSLLWGPGSGWSSGTQCNGYYAVGYADDIAIIINGKFFQTVSEILHRALCTVQQWCKRTKLSTNPNKRVVIPFTRNRNIEEPILFSRTIQLFTE
jgi:hypothetical protein